MSPLDEVIPDTPLALPAQSMRTTLLQCISETERSRASEDTDESRRRWPTAREARPAIGCGIWSIAEEIDCSGGTVVTVWMVRTGDDAPRLVTAYPGER
jgi:hypothetical protein